MRTGTILTAKEYYQRPETNLPEQLINGEVIEMTAPELDHQDVVANVLILLRQAAKRLGGKAYVAPTDVELDSANVVQPDVLYLAPESACQPLGTKRLIGPPDLVVEVLSPTTARLDRRDKFRLYEHFGVREYWIVEPRDGLVSVWQAHDAAFVLLNVYGTDEQFTSSVIGEVMVRAVFEV